GRCPTCRHHRSPPCAPARARRATAHSSSTPVRFHACDLEHYPRHLACCTAMPGGSRATAHLRQPLRIPQQGHHLVRDVLRRQVGVGDDLPTARRDDRASVEFLFPVP